MIRNEPGETIEQNDLPVSCIHGAGSRSLPNEVEIGRRQFGHYGEDAFTPGPSRAH